MQSPLQTLASFAFCLESSTRRSAKSNWEGDDARTLLESPSTSTPSATQLSSLLVINKNLEGSSSSCSFPSLWLGPIDSRRVRAGDNQDDASYSSNWMSESIKVAKAHVETIPLKLLRNVTASFGTVLDETKREYLREAFDRLRPSCNFEPYGSKPMILRAQAIQALASSHSISFSSARTQISSSPLSKGVFKASHGDFREVELPLSFIVTFDVLILGYRRVSIQLEAPGVIRGTYTLWETTKLNQVSLEIDTVALYLAMRNQSISLLKTAYRASMVMMSRRHTACPTKNTEHNQDIGVNAPIIMKPNKNTKVNPYLITKPNSTEMQDSPLTLYASERWKREHKGETSSVSFTNRAA